MVAGSFVTVGSFVVAGSFVGAGVVATVDSFVGTEVEPVTASLVVAVFCSASSVVLSVTVVEFSVSLEAVSCFVSSTVSSV